MKNFKNIGTYTIIRSTINMKITVPKYYEEELVKVGTRIADLTTYHDSIKKKKDFSLLLDKINKISADIDKIYNDSNTENEEHSNCIYLFGKISILTTILLSILENIQDVETQNQFTEQDKKIIETAKNSEKIDYTG